MALPQNILIIGGGVFGLSTALSLSKRHPKSQVTIVESSPTIPNPHGSSVDTSRIVRADYANAAYSKLAAAAIERWRNTDWGREGRYTQNGLLLVYPPQSMSAEKYARKSYANVRKIEGDNVQFLPSQKDVLSVVPAYGKELDVAGGYVNWGSGWSDAAAAVAYAKSLLDAEGKVGFLTGDVQRILYEDVNGKSKARGVMLADGRSIEADLVVVAGGAWSSKLVDLRGRAVATGQAIGYMRISDEEQRELENLPTILNFETGIFIIPPRHNLLKIARHAFGYRNPTAVPVPGGEQGRTMEVSLPENGAPVPAEGLDAFRVALKQLLPRFVDREFVDTRVCWYTDTPKGDFIVSYHPEHEGLFLATGGSGHAFKFFPVLGDKVVDAMEGTLDPELSEMWTWSASAASTGEDFDGDGSRSGERRANLKDELAKTKKATRSSVL
ncbi:unnamed protein product [Penicillium salamii]|uniref:FAD dependent oxidoreductase domain-containing protein n=1 Tax=Penicillium salamii TaxID=1612424 RepID=A0A9W4N9E4_9EURO|nr:unnamed protein product [Penicillium salamii]CAG8008939.1 unnamed protein product [Penicillium salamii]CAG8066313.1 unnamed protein product [Penicillium salamii]CAG8249790.1 unnamed protein product [Penicillium salamii]CAG8308584.1 unnamed protein product [Penicillium salamii]